MKSLIVLISNPAARSSSVEKVKRADQYLRSKGFETELFFTERRGHAEELAQKAIKNNPHLVIAAGGDGTINEVINGMVTSETPLAILPLGTTNVLARELSIPRTVEGAMERAVAGKSRTISLGKIEALSESKNLINGALFTSKGDDCNISPPLLKAPTLVRGGDEGEGDLSGISNIRGGRSMFCRYFCLMAGIGFDAAAVYGVNSSIKKISGEGAYFLSGINTLLRYNPNELVFSVDGKQYTGYAAIIGNVSRYGGNFKVTPDAEISQPGFYLCIFKGSRRTDILRYAAGVLTGTHLKQKDILYLRASNILISGNAHIQIDGDYLGTTPASISTVKDSLRLVW